MKARMSSAAPDLAWWGTQPEIGLEGRKLPVCGTWASTPMSDGWNDKYLRGQIDKGIMCSSSWKTLIGRR